MRTSSVLVGIAVAAGAFVIGRWSATASEPVDANPVAEPQPAPAPRARRAVQGLVCARAHASPESDDSCEETELRARWCESELAECRRQRQSVRNEWPEGETVEEPGAWSDTIEQAFAECEIPGELELIDCTEYPCTAAIRPPAPPTDGAQFKAQMEATMQAVRACAPLREAFGVDGGDVTQEQVEEALDVYRLDAECSGEREKFLVLAALAPTGAAYELLHKQEMDAQDDRDLNRWMYRRADDLSALWPCAD